MSLRALWLCIVLLIGSGMATDMPFVFDEKSISAANYTSSQLESIRISSPDLVGVPSITMPKDDEVLTFPVTGGGNTSSGKTEKKVSDLKNTLNSRVEPDNSAVHEKALVVAGRYPGDRTVEQICAIYSHLKNGDSLTKKWSYVEDPRGLDYFSYANTTLRLGDKIECAGIGDCDDFAILMSALIESIGGATRIIMAHNNTTGGHAYTEVYLGQDSPQNSQVKDIIDWLKKNFDIDKVYTHIDTDTKDVWLNLDWSADHPGGPFYPGDKHIPLRIRDGYAKFSLTLPEKPNKPPKIISLASDKPSPQDSGAFIAWTVEARDPEKDQILYRFFLNEDPVTKWIKDNRWVWNITDDDVGENQIEVRVRDGVHSGPDGFDSNNIASFKITKLKSPMPENRSPVINSLVPDKSSPQDAGMAITWIAKADDLDNDQILFRFFLSGPSTSRSSRPMTDWTTDNTWTWKTNDADVGVNQIEVRIRDEMHAGTDSSDDCKSASFIISAPVPPINRLPTIGSLTSDKPSPQEAGATITWNVDATDPEGDQILYRFFLNSRPATEWTANSKWIWTTSDASVGNNQIEVQVIDGKHAGADSSDDSEPASFAITTPNMPPTITSLNPDKSSPQNAGIAITWTAKAGDPDSDQILYRFFLNGNPVTKWITDNKWVWTTTEGDVGDNWIVVHVRDGRHADPDRFDSNKAISFTIVKLEPVPQYEPSREDIFNSLQRRSTTAGDKAWAARGSGRMGRPYYSY